MGPVIKFSYLGSRTYLDITSILDSLWQYFGFEFRAQVKDMEFKLLSPITENCFIVYGRQTNLEKPENFKVAAEFSWIIAGNRFYGYLIPNGEKIVSRIAEPELIFKDHCAFENNIVTLKKNFKADVCYNLTKMGKFLISHFQDPNVRIVKFFFKELLPSQDMIGAQLRMTDLKKKGFIKVICEKNDMEFGHILIKTGMPHDKKFDD